MQLADESLEGQAKALSGLLRLEDGDMEKMVRVISRMEIERGDEESMIAELLICAVRALHGAYKDLGLL